MGACCALLVLMLGMAGGCSGSQADLVPGGSWFETVAWPHDGRPYVGQGFTVYSDAADQDTKRDVAARAERLWSGIASALEIDLSQLHRSPGDERVDIYLYVDRSPEWTAKAYPGGIVMPSPSRRTLLGLFRTRPDRYDAILEHELVHVVSDMVLRSQGTAPASQVPVWFFEGLAESISGGTGAGSIRGADHFDDLITRYGSLNPISYLSDEEVVGGSRAFSEYHYPMWHLAVDYLFAEDGMARPVPEATGLFLHMAGGVRFEEAFSDRFGMEVADYRDRFFELMDEYLPQRSRPIPFTRQGVVFLWLVTTVAAVFLAVLESRRVRGNPLGIGFGSAVLVGSSIALFGYSVGVFELLDSWSTSTPGKVVIALVLLAYLVVSAVAIATSVRRRRAGSVAAWVLPFVPLPAAVLAVVPIAMVI